MIHYIKLMRPHQWIKNLAVLAGPVFAQEFDRDSLIMVVVVFAAFCLVSSASYGINDLMDRESDALHPKKRFRPLASGAISGIRAILWSGFLLAAGMALSVYTLPPATAIIVFAYFLMILAYSLSLKRRIILDIIIIAVGFVMRATAGAGAIEAFISPWLIVCTFTLCMFMGFGKRRCEIAQFKTAEEAGEHRKVLLRYTPELLNNLISVSAGITIMTFLLYTMDHNTPTTFPKHHLIYTIPLVAYGVFRYSMLCASGSVQGPVEIVLRDRPFQATVLLWGLVAFAIMTEYRWADRDFANRILGGGLPKQNVSRYMPTPDR